MSAHDLQDLLRNPALESLRQRYATAFAATTQLLGISEKLRPTSLAEQIEAIQQCEGFAMSPEQLATIDAELFTAVRDITLFVSDARLELPAVLSRFAAFKQLTIEPHQLEDEATTTNLSDYAADAWRALFAEEEPLFGEPGLNNKQKYGAGFGVDTEEELDLDEAEDFLSEQPEDAAEELDLGEAEDFLSEQPEDAAEELDLDLDFTPARIHFEHDHFQLVIPKGFANCANIQQLAIYDLPMTEVPEGIEQLTGLEGLYLYRTQVRAIPATITQLPKLRDFQTEGSPIEQFAPFPAESVLESLTVSAKALKSLSRLPQLDILAAHHAEYADFPSDFAQRMPALSQLILQPYASDKLPASFAQFPALTDLTIDNESLAEANIEIKLVDNEVFATGFEQLSTLSLSYIGLPSPLRFGASVRNLKKLILIDNQLAELPTFTAEVPMEELDVESQPLQRFRIDAHWPKLTYLCLRDCEIADLAWLDPAQFPALTDFEITSNPIQELPAAWLTAKDERGLILSWDYADDDIEDESPWFV